MDDLKLFRTIFSKENKILLGNFLADIAKLYARPYSTWKRIVRSRNPNGLVLFTSHVIYYSIFIGFISSNTKFEFAKFAFIGLILESITTALVYAALLLPHKFFVRTFNKRLPSYRMYWVLFILKVQFGTIFLLLISIYKSTGNEFVFYFVENLIPFLWIGFMIVIPITVGNLNIWKRLVWFFTNYLFCGIIIFIMGHTLFSLYDKKIISLNFLSFTPNMEITTFWAKSNHPYLYIDENYFIYSTYECEKLEGCEIAYYTTELITNSFINTFVSTESGYTHKLKYKFTTALLDSIVQQLEQDINADIKLVEDLSQDVKFHSTKEFLDTYSNFLLTYQKIHKSPELIKKAFSEGEIDAIYNSEQHNFVLIKTDKAIYKGLDNQFRNLDASITRRMDISYFVTNILFYPLELVVDHFGYYD